MKNRLSNVKKSGRAMKTTIPAAMLVMILTLLSGLFIARGTASAAMTNPPITVTTIADENDGVGVGTGTSLREAIAAAASGDTITFDTAGVFATPQTITLTLGQIVFYSSVTIQGPGASQLTVSGNHMSRIFAIASGAGTVNLSGLTIANGLTAADVGGGIYNASTLTISDSTVSGNSSYLVGGGGIFNDGTLTITNSTLSGNSANNGSGGGIHNYIGGMLTVANCTLSDNSSSNGGGGIFSRGTLTVSNSTLSGNSASSNGGGIHNFSGSTLTVSNCTLSDNSANNGSGILNDAGSTLTISNSTLSGNSATFGGGIYNNTRGTLMVSNSTLSGNSATRNGGGIYNFIGGTLAVNNSTLSGNSATFGGGIYNLAPLHLNSSIVANNTATIGPDIIGRVSSGDYNLIENPSGISGTLPGTHNLTGIDPLLGPLQNNGGTTATHALLAGSPAIDAGDDTVEAVPTTDQRGAGFPRLLDGNSDGVVHVDIGAVEFGVCPQPQGYWKNNPASWLVTSLTLGSQSYSQAELLTVLNTPVGTGKNADASLILAYQLIAAKLNVANGANPAPASATIAAADALLATFSGRLPYAVKPSSSAGQQMTSFAALLDQYNNGLLTTGCSP